MIISLKYSRLTFFNEIYRALTKYFVVKLKKSFTFVLLKFTTMEKLTRQEEKAMLSIWKIGKGFAKDVLENFPETPPHYNTISSLIRSLEAKGYVGHKAYGNTYEYYPLISKDEYTSQFLSGFIGSYFEDSYKEVVSFFAQEQKLSVEDLKEIIAIIEKNKK